MAAVFRYRSHVFVIPMVTTSAAMVASSPGFPAFFGGYSFFRRLQLFSAAFFRFLLRSHRKKLGSLGTRLLQWLYMSYLGHSYMHMYYIYLL